MTWHNITSIHATSNYITWHDLTVLVHYINPHHITSHHITSHYITLHYIHIYTYICVFSHRMYCILLQGFQNSAGPCWFPFICTMTDSWARWCAAASTCCGCASQGRDRWWDVMGIWLWICGRLLDVPSPRSLLAAKRAISWMSVALIAEVTLISQNCSMDVEGTNCRKQEPRGLGGRSLVEAWFPVFSDLSILASTMARAPQFRHHLVMASTMAV